MFRLYTNYYGLRQATFRTAHVSCHHVDTTPYTQLHTYPGGVAVDVIAVDVDVDVEHDMHEKAAWPDPMQLPRSETTIRPGFLSYLSLHALDLSTACKGPQIHELI